MVGAGGLLNAVLWDFSFSSFSLLPVPWLGTTTLLWGGVLMRFLLPGLALGVLDMVSCSVFPCTMLLVPFLVGYGAGF